MLKIISFTICPFVQRVTALLEAKQLPYDIEFISLSDKPAWFLKLAPNGQVPVLVTESGTALFESDAIVEYIEEAYAPLETGLTAEQKAINRAWSYLASKQYLVQCSSMRSADANTYAERSAKMSKAFATISQHKAPGAYFNGSQLSLVDMPWLPLLHRAAIIKQNTQVDLLAPWPNLQAWQLALADTGLFAASVANDFADKFINFYLAETTYLGQLSRNGAPASQSEERACEASVGGCC